MAFTDMFKRQKSIQEIEEDTETLEAENRKAGTELSIAQKREAIARLRERGLSPKHFNWDWKSIVAWVKSH